MQTSERVKINASVVSPQYLDNVPLSYEQGGPFVKPSLGHYTRTVLENSDCESLCRKAK